MAAVGLSGAWCFTLGLALLPAWALGGWLGAAPPVLVAAAWALQACWGRRTVALPSQDGALPGPVLTNLVPPAAPVQAQGPAPGGEGAGPGVPIHTAAGHALLRFEPVAVAGPEAMADRVDLDALLEGLEQVLFQLDAAGRCLFMSRGWQRFSGQPSPHCVGRLLSSLLHPDDQGGCQTAITGLCQDQGQAQSDTLQLELRVQDRAGASHWVVLRARALALSLPGPASTARPGVVNRPAIAGSMARLLRPRPLDDSLREGRRRLNTLLANVPGMVYRGLNDRDWTMEFVSDGSYELTGYEPREFIDKANRSFGDLIHPEDREFVWTLVQGQLAQFKPFQLSYRIVDAVGDTKWVWEQGRGIFSSTGELLALEGFITDVSARRGAEEQARRRLWFEARTGLASHAIFEDRLIFVLEHTRFAGSRCALLLVELDDFAALKERHGHDLGDRLLVQLARRFKVVQGPGSTVSRTLGDQFAVLLTDFRLGGAPSATPTPKELQAAAQRLAERIAQAMAEPLRLDELVLRLSVSIGLVLGPSGHASAEAMMQAARNALQTARASGPGRWHIAEE